MGAAFGDEGHDNVETPIRFSDQSTAIADRRGKSLPP
jgi:hypothetical protein